VAGQVVAQNRGVCRARQHADAERNPAIAHLFIVNPLRGANLATLFASHPATEQRVRRIEAMAAARGMGSEAHAAAGAGPWRARRPA
jgi:heat shock protein HtpX